MSKDLLRQQHQSQKARIKRAKAKLVAGKTHLEAAIETERRLLREIHDAEQALAALPPIEFTPKTVPGAYFPNIYYTEVYNETNGGSVVDRMRHWGLLCETKSDASLISVYLRVIGKIANYALQANRSANEAQFAGYGYVIGRRDGAIKVFYDKAGTSLPTFNLEEDADTVLAKYLTDNDKKVLLKGI